MNAAPQTERLPLLRAVGLGRRYGGVAAVEDVDLEIYSGETVGVIGANGAGKSTLIGLLSGAIRPTSGDIFFAGRRINGMPRHRIAQLGVGRTYQIPQPFSRMSVLENLMLGRLYGAGDGYRAARRGSLEILERTGLGDVADVPASELGLLRLKRLELARGLALKPRLLLLDEIGAGLVESEINELIVLVNELRAEVESILIVEHVIDVIRESTDRVVVLDWGRKLLEGEPETVLGDDQVTAVYLGTGTSASLRRTATAAPRSQASRPATATSAFCTTSRSRCARARS
jgi:ABC-type branched-subunit amino acid transport system ATPase component